MHKMEDKKYEKEMTEYRSIAKYITQIAISALVLPTIFIKNFVIIEKGETVYQNMNLSLKVSWVLLLIAIGSGIWYQYVATKKILEGKKSKVKRYPFFFFTLTMTCFYLGVLLFTIGVVILN